MGSTNGDLEEKCFESKSELNLQYLFELLALSDLAS
jgi:hypothetical protein